MPVVKFFLRLDLEEKLSFLDRHQVNRQTDVLKNDAILDQKVS